MLDYYLRTPIQIENSNMFWTIMYSKYIVLIAFSIYFHQYITLTNYRRVSILITTIIPLLIIVFRDALNISLFEDIKHTKEKENLLREELKKEEMLLALIPALTFGISLMLSGNNNVRVLEHVMPYLAATLLIGTIIPLILSLFSTHRSVGALLELESVIMALEFSSMGYITCAIVLIFLHYRRKVSAISR